MIMPPLQPSWTLEAFPIYWLRRAETELNLIKPYYHVALTGSVLTRGESNKDLDVIVYPHQSTDEPWSEAEIQAVVAKLVSAGLLDKGVLELRDHHDYGDEKLVYKTAYNSQRIDLFFLR